MQAEAMAQCSGVLVPAWRFLLAGKPCSLCLGLLRRTCHQHVWVLLQVLRCFPYSKACQDNPSKCASTVQAHRRICMGFAIMLHVFLMFIMFVF